MRPALRFWLVVWGGVLLGSVLVWLTPPASATELHTTIPLQNAPLDIAVNAQTNRLYVVDGTARLSVVDTTRDRLHSSVLVGGSLVEVLVDPGANRVYAAGQPPDSAAGATRISVVDGAVQRVVDQLDLVRPSSHMALDGGLWPAVCGGSATRAPGGAGCV